MLLGIYRKSKNGLKSVSLQDSMLHAPARLLEVNSMALDLMAAFTELPPPIDYVLPNMVAGTVGAIVSPGGAGKSMLALQLATQIAGGPDLLKIGEFLTGAVAYLPAEDPTATIHHRLHVLGAHLTLTEQQAVADGLLIEPLIGRCPDIMSSAWFDGLIQVADGRRLLILDTLRRFHIEEENASGPMSQVIGRMEAIAVETGCAIVFLHHSSKGATMMGAGDQQQASRGSSVLVDNIRWQSYLSGMTPKEAEELGVNDGQRGYFVRFGVSKANYGAPFPERWLRRHEGGVLKPAVLERRRKTKEVLPFKKSEIALEGADDNW
ncbi:IncQ-type replication protein A [Aeromonas hydrophila ML09-119]|nr:IncQ-type replication protein A [Aeromonas hydrophila ML09-119]